LVVALVGAVLTPSAYAVPVTSGYYSAVFFRNCELTTCDGFTKAPTAFSQEISPDGVTSVSASYQSVPTTTPLTGSGAASTALVGGLLTPELKAEAQIGATGWMSSQGLAVQRYVNTGADPITVSLNAVLDWTISDGTTPPGQLPNVLRYVINVFENDSGLIDVDFSNATLGGFQLNSVVTVPSAVDHLLYRREELFFASGSANVASPDIIVNPGKGIFLGAWLVAGGGFGASVDGFHTFNTFFTDANGVLGASSALKPVTVPEPATFSLIIAGLAGLGFMRRRRGAQQPTCCDNPGTGCALVRPKRASRVALR
jgi:hypothetical protein